MNSLSAAATYAEANRSGNVILLSLKDYVEELLLRISSYCGVGGKILYFKASRNVFILFLRR